MIAGRGASRSCASFFCLMSCRLISSDEGKQDNGAGFASPSYLIRVRAWAFYLDAILVSLIVSASRVVGRLASCRRDVSCVSSDEGQASKEAGRVIILGPVSSASAPSSVRPGVPSPGSRAVITSSPASKQAGGENETASWRRRGSFLSSSGERRGVVILPSAWRFYSHARRR